MQARQIRTGRVAWTSDSIDVRRPFPVALVLLGLAALALGALGSSFLLLAGAVLLLVGTANFVGLRLAADAQGLSVRSWHARHSATWDEVADVRLRAAGLSGACIEIALKDGRVMRPGATRATRLGYSARHLEEIVQRLDGLRDGAAAGRRP